ncbi:MAG: hypothetical protein U0736_10020 [Gemmataceae bacterium]
MPITFTCAKCQARMTVPDNLAGKHGKCSKCKEPVTVPGADAAAAPPSTNGGPPVLSESMRATRGTPPTKPAVPPAKPAPEPPPPPAPKVPPVGGRVVLPPPPPPPEPEHHDLEDHAHAALRDAPREEAKPTDLIEFDCPMCGEPLKLAADLGGKRHPCPECKRIIAVPVPQKKDPANWRDTGPKLPTAARRPDQPAPEGAWGSTAAKAVSREALLETGVIQEKQKPLTFYQRAQPYLLVGVPLLLVVAGGIGVWQWMHRNQERNALQYALTAAASPAGRKALTADGLIALHGAAGEYYLRGGKPGAASQSREQYGKAISLAAAGHSSAGDALLVELAVAQLNLVGTDEDLDGDFKLTWRDTQKVVRATLAAIKERPARTEALRQVVGRLIREGQTERVLPLVGQLYTAAGADRSEALALAGTELARASQTAQAKKALEEAVAPYRPDDKAKGKDAKKKADRPSLRSAVVALAVVLGVEPPPPGTSIAEDEARLIGRARGLARLGKLDEAQAIAGQVAIEGGARLRAFIAVAAAAQAEKAADPKPVTAALELIRDFTRRPEMAWPLLRLVDLGVRAGVDPQQLEPAIRAIVDPQLAAWARLLVFRSKLAASRSVEPADSVDAIPAATLGGLVARLELARHNTAHSTGWAGTVGGWDEGPRAVGSLGVALGMQGGR